MAKCSVCHVTLRAFSVEDKSPSAAPDARVIVNAHPGKAAKERCLRMKQGKLAQCFYDPIANKWRKRTWERMYA
jgi:hypothetical protein